MANELRARGSNSYAEERRQSTNLISKRSLIHRLREGAETRVRFVESQLSKGLAFQLRSLRDRKGWSQEELANKVGMNQNAISRLENPNYGRATITTLRRIAAVFDVALVIRFVPFSQLADWVSGTPSVDYGLTPRSLAVPNFSEEERSGVFETGSAGNIPILLGMIEQDTKEMVYGPVRTGPQISEITLAHSFGHKLNTRSGFGGLVGTPSAQPQLTLKGEN